MVIYISLGKDCSIAYQLQKRGLRKQTLPFDWLVTKSFSQVIRCIESGFQDFFEDFKVVKQSDKFPLLDDDWSPKGENETLSVVNSYGFIFHHDFHSDLSSEIPSVKEKYQRRIDRLLQLVKEEKNEIVFLRVGGITPEERKKFRRVLKVNQEQLQILPKKKSGADWRRDDLDWNSIFSQN